ncbi:hypothetical protein QLL95_gp1098 [Cotonvirus japonicus]|uniref:BRCT domain-containing protein n=1 Tax=Cotonvirus japonicus TaxID=2811091 RepID=A0ABM7NS87_9VIRU|nr:hypothetical protein QLL95_gp1098 [Cotonvirus japonicus]BCS83025.1 hypothetical protein [Cotonvirus japonicus]
MGKSKSNSNNNTENSDSDNKSKSNSSNVIYKYNDVDINKLKVSKIFEGSSQKMAFINYYNENLKTEIKFLVQTGFIETSFYGIPTLSKENDKKGYYKSDDDREFTKIPLDTKQKSCRDLREFFVSIDNFLGSKEVAKTLFNNKAKHYKYQPCIRKPKKKINLDDDDDKEVQPEIERPEFIKAAFNMVGSKKDGTRKSITKLIESSGGQRTVIKADTITEIANKVRYKSTAKYILYLAKIWIGDAPLGDSDYILYGAGIKVIAVEYKPSASQGISGDIDFNSDEDDEELEKESEGKTNKTKSPTKPTKAVKLDSDDENNKESDNENNDDNTDKKSSKKKSSKNKNSDDDDDDVKVKKSSKKKSSDDEEDNDDDDIKVKKSTKKPSSKKSSNKKHNKKDEEDEEDEDDVEEVKPKKKSSKAKSPSKSK